MPEIAGLQFQQTSARGEEDNNPRETAGDAQTWGKKLGCAETKKNDGEEVGSGADQEIENAGEDGAEFSDQVLGNRVRRRKIAPRHPSGEVARVVGNERE